MTILEEFFCGNVIPSEFLEMNSHYKKTMGIILEKEKILKEILPEKEKELFFELTEIHEDFENFLSKEYFIEGWKLGVKFMIETFKEKK
ncbi:MAG: hypothetical protein IJX57_05870 [Clostridia bacterium]|nr:hypothetical protein [Clostridia bacterium]